MFSLAREAADLQVNALDDAHPDHTLVNIPVKGTQCHLIPLRIH